MIRLYIENTEIELDENVQFAINKEFEELVNPTVIINDWSKTVSIPFTLKNNLTFGHIYSPDKVTVAGSGMGIYFDPLKQLDFRIECYNTVLMVGYAKMNEVKQVNGVGTYEITLFGQLGKIFHELEKITFNETTDNSTYLINGGKYVDETINKLLIYNSWVSSGQTQSQLYPRKLVVPGGAEINHPAYRVTDIIGFAPNNSFGEDFDYKTVQASSSTTQTFEEMLENNNFEASTGITPRTVIPNGFLPREIGEFRSHLQLPYIYWNKLFLIFQAKAEEITGYEFLLDTDWFTTTNPYWYNLVYMLNPLNNIKNPTYANTYTGYSNNSATVQPNSSKKYHYDFPVDYTTGISWTVQQEQKPLLVPAFLYNTYFDFDGTDVIEGQMSLHLKMDVNTNLGSQLSVHIRNNGVFIIDVYMTDLAGSFSTRIARIAVKDANSTYVPGYTTHTVSVGTQTIPSGSYVWTLFENDFSIEIPSDLYDKTTKFCFTINGFHAETAFSGSLFVNTNPSSVDLGNITVTTKPNIMRLNVTGLAGKSYSTFTLNDLWNNEFNLFNEIIKYCKMYRIGIFIDELNKKIVFRQFSKYFSSYTITDWTNKVDKSKDFNIVPVTFDNKYVVFNYEDGNSELNKTYKEKFGVNFGEYKLDTHYNFNTESTNLFDGIQTSLVNTDNSLSILNLFQNKIIYSYANEIFVDNKSKDKKQVETFGRFYFFDGLATFNSDSTINMVYPVKISDDSEYMRRNNIFFYTFLQNDYITTTTYPKLDVVKGDNMCLFNIPKENYTYTNNYSGKSTIYTNFWQTYLNERYNVQNKKITCYLRLSPMDWQNFDYNHFVKIGNLICMVNKIYDYDITANTPTKVDLITIQDIAGYTTVN